MYEANHYLRLRKPNQPQTGLVADSPDKDMYLNDFVWVSDQWEFQVDDPGHFKVPRHRGYIPVGKSGLNLFSFTSVFRIYFVFASGFMPSWLLDLCFVGL